MARRTKEEIQKEVAEATAAREKAYFEAQAKAQAGAKTTMPNLPAPDVYKYSYAWKQDPGAATGEYTLIKSPNPTYDPSTNTIVDPATGKRVPVTPSMWSGPTTFRATDPNAKDPVTGLTLAQKEAADALALAKGNSAALAAALGAKIDPNTGKIIPSTIDPTKAAAWYASQNPNANVSDTAVYAGSGTDESLFTKDGKPFTGTYNGKSYVNGILKTTSSSSTLVNNAATSTSTSTSVTGFGPGSQGYTDRKSAYDLLYAQFQQYGLASLVEPLKGLIESGISPSEFTLRLRDTDAYKKRFAANAQRIAKGLRALSEAEYIGLEDQYQNVMRNYGMPESYYTRGDMGIQQGFEKFIAGDVSAAELEDRIQTAQDRLLNAAPEIMGQLKGYYNISDGDILTYILDPQNAITQIKRKVQAAEIGGAAVQAGLDLEKARAEELQRYGVTGEAYRRAAPTIKQAAERGSQLASFFKATPYTQQTAESMALGVGDAASAEEATRKLIEKERGLYSGQIGKAQGALSRERAGQF